jgi:hypothetical protein
MEAEANVPQTGSRAGKVPLYSLGLLLLVGGIVIYVVQFNMRQLVVPWYMPIMATVGSLLMLVAYLQRRSALRLAGFILADLVTIVLWLFLLVFTVVPAYAGPGPGKPLPAFTATLADGRPFSEKDFRQGGPSVLVLFRGRW